LENTEKCKRNIIINNPSLFFKKLKIELPYDPEVALLGIYPKDAKIQI